MKLTLPAATAAAALAAAAALLPASAASAAAGGTLVSGELESAVIGGPIDYTVYLPEGYDPDAADRYPSLYLLHGRGDTMAAWQQVAGDLDELIADGSIPPLVVVMPDAPWSSRGGYYVDSLYTGDDPATTPGEPVETAFTGDLVAHIDAEYRTIDDRAARAVGGYSMGGAGALRYVTAHQDLFSAAIVLSPAVYVPTTPAGGSSTQEFGAYGVGDELFDPARYDELNYPAGLAALDPAEPIHLFIAVGDDEYVNPDPADAAHDLDYEAATLYNAAKRVNGVTAEFRVYDGGHDWGVWERGFREGIVDLAGYLQSSPPEPLEGDLAGSGSDDYAGGVLARPDGTVVQAVNATGGLFGAAGAGGLDGVVQARDADGDQLWATTVGSAAADRLYGVVDAGDGGVIVAGYSRGDLDGAHPSGASDDAVAARLDADGGVVWTTQFGTSAADRVYAAASDGAGGAYLAGYTSGALDGESNAGDKDAVLARVGADGALLWARQLGGPGEDKALAVAVGADGAVYIGGVAGSGMPGVAGLGGSDGWAARFSPEGERDWVVPVGTAESDQVAALAPLGDGVAAAGFTGGMLGAASAGGDDAFVRALGSDGATVWTTQDGSAGDDRAAALVAGEDGLLVVGHTNGRIAASSGGVDLFTLRVAADGAVRARSQLGTTGRDGADEYDEASLFAAADGVDTVWVQGITTGSLPGATNAGGTDVFLAALPWAGSEDGAGTSGGSGGDGGSGGAPAGAGGPNALGSTGQTIGAALLAVAALLIAGAGLVTLRRSRASRAH